jgi:hypothetical protein
MKLARPLQAAPGRRFTLLDAMVVILALAAGLGVLKHQIGLISWIGVQTLFERFRAWSQRDYSKLAILAIELTMPMALATTIAVLVLRLRQPRPRWRRLTRQPGFVACLAASSTSAFAGFAGLLNIAFQPAGFIVNFTDPFGIFGMALGGLAVALLWVVFSLAGLWRPEPSWIDRAGRVVGVGWIGMLVASWTVLIVESHF